MLEVVNLSKTYATRRGGAEVRALDGIDFAVPSGETFGLLGPNGAGKTTTMRLVAGMLRPSGGDARFDGRPVSESPERIRQITGVVCEAGGAYDRLTAQEYLQFFARMFRLERSQAARKTDELVDRFDLKACRNRRIGTFSKGMKQKVNIARALLHEPRLLLLDEPTSGLDPAMTETLWSVLGELCRTRSVITVLCTHNLDEADRLCDRVAIIVNGKILKQGRLDQLKSEVHESGGQAVQAVLAEDCPTVSGAVRRIDGVTSAEPAGNATLRIVISRDCREVNPQIAKAVVDNGGQLVSLQQETTTLREVYLRTIKGGQA